VTSQAAVGTLCCLRFFVGAEAAFTSLRFFTVKPSGSVPSASMRKGQRLQRGLSTQHFFFGFDDTREAYQ